jgi:aminopeptidase
VRAVAAGTVERTGALLEPGQLERYADAIVVGCLDVGSGDQLFVTCEPAHRELAVALADSAYRAGARLVEVLYDDAHVRAARLRHARDEHLGTVPPWALQRLRETTKRDAAAISILGEADPGALDGIPPERISADYRGRMERTKPIRRLAQRGKRRWCGCAWPTEAWAALVYPELGTLDSQRQLAADLLSFCRLGPDDPPGFEGWVRHSAHLAERNDALTELDLRGLELRGPGTRLDLKLVPRTRWLGGPRENAYGYVNSQNFPTEENFTSPDARGTEGTFRCSRPLLFQQRIFEGIAGEFRGGRLVRLEASRDEDRDVLASFLMSERDPNAARLGEVALVDRTSRIGRTGRVYWNTLLDENAAAHMAFGFGFGNTRLPDADGRVRRRQLNDANIHLDVMIGTDDFEATGIRADGSRIPLIADGTWQV